MLTALVLPNEVARLTPAEFARIPVEALVGVIVMLVLPARARAPVAIVVGVLLGLITVLKLLDMGFLMVLGRPFDAVLDWSFLANGQEYLTTSVGRPGAIGAAVGIVVLLVVLLTLMALAVLRLGRVIGRHSAAASASAATATVIWVALAVLGTQIVPGRPMASRSATMFAYEHGVQINNSLRDQGRFATEAEVDAFRDTPGSELLTGLRGKDVLLAFVESYGRDAIEDPVFATEVSAVLEQGNTQLAAAGFSARSGFLTSPTSGGGSWLAHSTLLSGIRVDNQQRYRTLVASDRFTLNQAFKRADWRTVALMPGVTRAWPEGDFFGFDQIYPLADLNYRGPTFGWSRMPDQYVLGQFEKNEDTRTDRPPVMAEIALTSSHAPWAPVPSLVDWDELGDGQVYQPIWAAAPKQNEVWTDPDLIRVGYRQSIEYSLKTLISYAETHGDDDLVLVVLGDHQPTPLITGPGADNDVPISIIAKDPAVLDAISDWNWTEGLKPTPTAPVWPMESFRDRFLTAFSPSANS